MVPLVREPSLDTSRPFTRAQGAAETWLAKAASSKSARRRYDLCWPSVRVIVEYDGRHHIEREQNWESDLDRREAIDDDGWRILVVTGAGIYREPQRTVCRVWRLLRARRLPGVPRRPSDGWRPHFPGH
jgi:hypothetical protein